MAYDGCVGAAAGLAFEILTSAPSAGAGPLSVRVTAAGCAAGVIRTVATWLDPPHSAPTETVVAAVTEPAWTLKLAVVCPAGIDAAGGAGNAVRFPLERPTCTPSSGAGALKVRVMV